jgi:hypothetical protein
LSAAVLILIYTTQSTILLQGGISLKGAIGTEADEPAFHIEVEEFLTPVPHPFFAGAESTKNKIQSKDRPF